MPSSHASVKLSHCTAFLFDAGCGFGNQKDGRKVRRGGSEGELSKQTAIWDVGVPTFGLTQHWVDHLGRRCPEKSCMSQSGWKALEAELLLYCGQV